LPFDAPQNKYPSNGIISEQALII